MCASIPQEMIVAYCRHVALMSADEIFVPKHHIVFHLLDRVKWFGNPRLYATWLDEALNKTLKAICRQTSQSTFERSVLWRMREVLRSDVKRPHF
jgi:hypothetical protein